VSHKAIRNTTKIWKS